MAPNLVAITSQRNIGICPCCQKQISLVPMPASSSKDISTDIHSKLHCTDMASAANTNNKVVRSLTAPQDIRISSASWKKLLDFFELREQAHRNSRAANLTSAVLNRELTFFSSDLSFLLQNRKCVGNLYITPGKAPEKATEDVYQNDVTVEISRLVKTFQTVEACLWYWGDISNKEASKLLENEPLGTFLLRNSSDPRHFLTLSVVTPFGPTSIRIVYSNGKFDFDADETGKKRKRSKGSSPIPSSRDFQQCVIHMILLYTEFLISNKATVVHESAASSSPLPQFGGNFGDLSSNAVSKITSDLPLAFYCTLLSPDGLQKFPLVLSKPYLRKNPSLCEQTRFTINRQTKLWKNPQKADTLPLSNEFRNFLAIYPYPV